MKIYRDEEEIGNDPMEVNGSAEKQGREHDWSGVRSAAQRAVRHASAVGPEPWKARVGGFANKRVWALAIIGAVLLAAIAAYFLFNRPVTRPVQPPTRAAAPSTTATPAAQPAAQKETPTGLPGLLGNETSEQQADEPWMMAGARITLKLALGALLATLLAFRPRKDSPLTLRNPYVAQTQILLAVVAAALMMIVADNAARAFGIFAAASLVRFRTNIRDPKEITVLLISLGIGLACGVGKVEVAIILSLFSLLVLSLLEYYESDQVFRAMELTVATRKVEETDEILREIFEKRNMTSELRKVDREDPDNPMGKIVYFVNVGGDLSTDKLSEEIFSSDPENIDAVQWDQKKTSSYIYR